MGRPPSTEPYINLTPAEISAVFRWSEGQLAKVQWILANFTSKMSMKIHPQDVSQAMRGVALRESKIKLIRAVLSDHGVTTNEEDLAAPKTFPRRRVVEWESGPESLDIATINRIYHLFGTVALAHGVIGPLSNGSVGRILLYEAMSGKKIPFYKKQLILRALEQHEAWLESHAHAESGELKPAGPVPMDGAKGKDM